MKALPASERALLLAEKIEHFRQAKPPQLGDKEWEAVSWPVTTSTRADRSIRSIYFTRHDCPAEPFEEPFASLARALVCCLALRYVQPKSIGFYKFLLYALRALYETCRDPLQLSSKRFEEASVQIQDHYNGDFAATLLALLEWIAETISKWGITARPITWRGPLRVNVGIEIDRRAWDREPITDDKFYAWAQMSASEMADDLDHIRQRAIDLLVAATLRISEVRCLPANPLVRQGDRLGLIYFPEKVDAPCLKPIPTEFIPVVERAVKELQILTEPARQVALAHFEHRSIWPDIPEDKLLRADEVARLVGRAGQPMWMGRLFIQHYKIPYSAGTYVSSHNETFDTMFVAKKDLEAVLRSKSDTGNLLKGKYELYLHQCLLVVPYHMQANQRGALGTSILLQTDSLEKFLAGSTYQKSIFDRLGIKTAAGEPVKLNAHENRSWFTSEGLARGLHPFIISRQLGHTDPRSVEAYDRRLAHDRAIDPSTPVGSRKSGKEVELRTFAADVDFESLETGQTGHATPLGFCKATYGEPPCECIANALDEGELVRRARAMDPTELRDLRAQTKSLLEDAETAMQRGDCGAAGWAAMHQRVLDALLDVLQTAS